MGTPFQLIPPQTSVRHKPATGERLRLDIDKGPDELTLRSYVLAIQADDAVDGAPGRAIRVRASLRKAKTVSQPPRSF